MSNTKQFLRISEACKQPGMPWTPTEFRRRLHNAKPRYNSRNELIPGSGDELLLKAVIQEGHKGSIWIDMKEVQNYMDKHRLAQLGGES